MVGSTRTRSRHHRVTATRARDEGRSSRPTRYAHAVNDRTPVTLGTVAAAPGTLGVGSVAVDLGDGATASIPIAIVHGSQPGPRVAVTAGIHGAEYVSIAALREVALSLDPATVRGTRFLAVTVLCSRRSSPTRASSSSRSPKEKRPDPGGSSRSFIRSE